MTGIITKVDAVKDPETADSLLKILNNKTLPLEKGYIGVINKSKFQVPSSCFGMLIVFVGSNFNASLSFLNVKSNILFYFRWRVELQWRRFVSLKNLFSEMENSLLSKIEWAQDICKNSLTGFFFVICSRVLTYYFYDRSSAF
jgi:hypothetical protein